MDFQKKFRYCPACGSNHFTTNCAKSKRCEACGFIFYLNPSAASAAFICNEDGHLLVCRRANEPAKGTLDLPGGFIDYNETGEAGISREVYEELGVEINNFNFAFSLPNNYHYSGLNVPTLDLFFEAKVSNQTTIKAADDVEECFFIPVNQLNPELFGLSSIKKAVKIFISTHENLENKRNLV